MKMKIGILGSRGIPNHYGGFEQFATYLGPGLVDRGAEVLVYNSHCHPFSGKQWKGVKIARCFNPEDRMGTAGQFIYDLNCIRDSRQRDFDILLQLGYTSSSVWFRLLPEGPEVVTNMDGLEWKRSKYSPPVRKFLKYAEKLAVQSSDILVADSEAIGDYLTREYDVNPVFIPYGAIPFENPDPDRLEKYNLEPEGYYLLIARLQPDNHIEEIMQGVLSSRDDKPLIIIGDTGSKYGKMLKKKFDDPQIQFAGGIFDQEALNQLRYFCKLYFHGHSAGGTNPSLLEAMASNALICAHDNMFNRSVLRKSAFYFKYPEDIAAIIEDEKLVERYRKVFPDENLKRIRDFYNWPDVIDSYYQLFEKLLLA